MDPRLPKALLDEALVEKWTQRLGDLLDVVAADGITLKEAMEFTSPLNADLWDLAGQVTRS